MELQELPKVALDKLEQWAVIGAALLPNMVLAVLVLAVFVPLSRWVRRLSRKQSAHFVHSEALQSLIGQVVFMFVLIAGVVIALNIMHLNKTVASLLAGAGIIGLALGFAFQDITANFIAGVFMAVRKPLSVGDVIKSNGYMGTVDQLDLRTTTLLNFEGQRITLPNKMVFQEPLENYSTSGHRRVDVSVGVSYGDDLRKASKLAKETIASLEGVLKDEPIQAHYTEFGDSSIGMSIRFWIKYPDGPSLLDVRTEAIIRVKEAFDEASISIPFPIRTLDLGIKGGVALGDEPLLVHMNGKQKSQG